MSSISESINSGFYRVWDATNSLWKRYSFWTKASDTYMDDGNSVQSNVSTLQSNVSTLQSNVKNTFTFDSSTGKLTINLDYLK